MLKTWLPRVSCYMSTAWAAGHIVLDLMGCVRLEGGRVILASAVTGRAVLDAWLVQAPSACCCCTCAGTDMGTDDASSRYIRPRTQYGTSPKPLSFLREWGPLACTHARA